jgi:hypothetical protein
MIYHSIRGERTLIICTSNQERAQYDVDTTYTQPLRGKAALIPLGTYPILRMLSQVDKRQFSSQVMNTETKHYISRTSDVPMKLALSASANFPISRMPS